jgi:hypothetical protein
VLSGLNGAKHDPAMFGRSSGDCDGIDVVAGQQLVKIIEEFRLGGFGGCSSAGGIVIPDGDEISVWVLACSRGVLGGMYVPESENGYLDRIGHERSFPRALTGGLTGTRASTVAVPADNLLAAIREVSE